VHLLPWQFNSFVQFSSTVKQVLHKVGLLFSLENGSLRAFGNFSMRRLKRLRLVL
jgi:hypothetical protein